MTLLSPINNYDNNIYQIHIYDKRINVIKRKKILCFDVCEPIYNGEYEINFSKEAMIKIYDYVNEAFNGKDEAKLSKTISLDNITDENEKKIIMSIILNNEDYPIITNDKK